ncbi:glycoside hydrolase superfamily [Stachybotrys elegans]|uniref:Beta-glucosidase cel3A n=1 Tax=Stachybotrys elegans TaxID=80388 RepID=A0A8K0SNJ5_9HYPO|nr:glycoside hydrolase superfamily [Stachybotrys elegans]
MLTSPSWIAGLVGLCAVTGAAQANSPITSDSHFYGQSPPVYPVPTMDEDGAWSDAISKARELVKELSLEEKVNMTGGTTSATGCSGFVPAISRLGFPGLCLADAGNGVRNTDFVSAWPSGMHVGASFNTELARRRAHFMGKEAKAKGVNVLLGPAIGPMGRVVEAGRTWEGFSIDPYLMGDMVYETVSGIQGAGVIATTKHFIAQEQETHRLATRQGPFQEAVSSNIDDRTMHEQYLWPFYDAVRAGTGSIMCSFNRLNNTYACQNSKALNGMLKGDLGFQGWVMTDWGAQHSGVASALGGLDVAMPSGATFWGTQLVAAVNNGSVPEATLDNMVTRILASWFQLKQDSGFPEPGYGMPLDLAAPHRIVDARDRCSKPTLFEGAVEGHVLVKNEGALPLDGSKMKQISLFGYSAHAPNTNNYASPSGSNLFGAWSIGTQSANITEVSLGWRGNLNITYADIAPNGTIISGGGSGATANSLFSAPYDALVAQAYEDGTALYHDFESANPQVNPASDACIVVGNVWATEGHDRPNLRDKYTDDLILNVAKKCANTIVVFHNAGVRLVDAFVDHSNVTAIIYAHVPGQDSGKALISLLYGKENFSGRLPYTVAKTEQDYGAVLHPDFQKPGETAEYMAYPQSDFEEGLLLDYRHFDAENIEPRYEFGFGLSYTTFEYSNLVINKDEDADFDKYPTGPVSEGGQVDLWDELMTVTVDVTNSGDVDGKEVAQLYLGIPGEGTPIRQLRGFQKPSLAAGETKKVEFKLRRRDLSVWSVVAQKWELQEGEYKVYVGRSSRDLPLEGDFEI